MSAPIFIDPVHDGAADPTVIYNRQAGEWWMFFTMRRTFHEGPGVEWMHGSPIGVATSPDGWVWTWRGTVDGLDAPGDIPPNTHWAPEVIFAGGEYHMYLSYIRGAWPEWAGHDRNIVHFTSPDLVNWTRRSVPKLHSDNVIDAAVFSCPDGLYRLWYKDEANGSATWVAISRDLYNWEQDGLVIAGQPDAPPHEGPNVFALGGYYWMITDEWRGLAVHRSADIVTWMRQGLILDKPGADPRDRAFARHADVVVQDGWAALYYFTHPEWDDRSEIVTQAQRRTTIHAARLIVRDGVLHCERDISGLRLNAPPADPS